MFDDCRKICFRAWLEFGDSKRNLHEKWFAGFCIKSSTCIPDSFAENILEVFFLTVKEDQEFITASAGNDVLAAETAVKNISDTSQGKIACRMSPRIIDFFKVIQISSDNIGALMFAFAAKILDLFSETS